VFLVGKRKQLIEVLSKDMHTLFWVHHTTTLHIEEQLVTEIALTLLSQHGHGLGHGHNERASPLPWRGKRCIAD